MIVKDEARIICATLAMLCSKIQFDYWVISDTGSTDTTREMIQEFFSNQGIEGELHCDEWVNFAHNRTKALAYAFGKTDLLLVFDADDHIDGTLVLPTSVTHDEYRVKFGSNSVTYSRSALVNNRKRFEYRAVLHEYIVCLEPSPSKQLRMCVLEGDYLVTTCHSGARSLIADKYLKDALMLEAAHAEALLKGDPLHERYAYYCANSYRDFGRYEDAIRWYKITLSQGNWAQEKYMSCLDIYNCYEALGQKEHGFFYLVKALHYDLERAECLYPLVVHYCIADENDVAYGYYRIVQLRYEQAKLQNKDNSETKLFLSPDVGNFLLPYYMIIVSDRVGDRACGVCMYEIIFRKKQRTFSHWHLGHLFYNLRFFLKFVGSVSELSNSSTTTTTLPQFAALANEYVRFLRENGVTSGAFDEKLKDYDYAEWGIHFNPGHIKAPGAESCGRFSRSECKSRRAILVYAGYHSEPWNYSSMTRGALGGSERAVAHLANELFKLGYTVYVSGDVLAEDVGVKYVGLPELTELLQTTPFHTVVCSRYISFLELYGAIASWFQFFVWAHDTTLLSYGCALSSAAIVNKWSDRIDGCVCQTQWHADEYARQYPVLKSRMRVINNGIDTALFPTTTKKVRNRFIYTSRTERGLSRLLDLWPAIMTTMPDATLVISTYNAFPCNEYERQVQACIDRLNQTNNGGQCIRHLGQLNAAQLYGEMGTADFWLYPTDFLETSCITAMEMLMSGVICLYYPGAGLTETMHGCGIQIARGSDVDTLVKIAHNEAWQTEQREQGRAYAEGCTWEKRAQQWNKLLDPHDEADVKSAGASCQHACAT